MFPLVQISRFKAGNIRADHRRSTRTLFLQDHPLNNLPDEPGLCDRVDAGAPWPTRTGLGGVCGAWAKGPGAGPGILRGRDPAGGFGSVGGDRPGTTAEGGPAHRGAGVGGPRAGGGGRDRAERVGLLYGGAV